MFNDELTNDACQTLVSQLAICASPFLCAHGRVSMVPVITLNEGETALGQALAVQGQENEVSQSKHHEEAFVDAYMRWRNRNIRHA